MTVKAIIKSGEYHDSVSLMLVGRDLTRMAGVEDASVIMATDANKAILREAGLFTSEIASASPNDLIIVVKGDAKHLTGILVKAEELLRKKSPSESQTTETAFAHRTIKAAKKAIPEANVAVISVAGRYAVDEAWDALKAGLHVLLFSDNVALEDEIALKKYASQQGLLLMGPGAGTAILNGVALGFANKIPSGPVGIVSAAGTGLQEVSTLLAKQGVGISQGIGVGGRDLKGEVGGIMMIQGLKALIEDPSTKIIILISKPPAPEIIQKILEQVGKTQKPTIICFLGSDLSHMALPTNVVDVVNLEEAALVGGIMARKESVSHKELIASKIDILMEKAICLRKRLQPGQKYIRGLFSGGTLCYEAQVIWSDPFGLRIYSNAPLKKEYLLTSAWHSKEHTAIDLGEEEFTVGRPHPMIDQELRIRRILKEAEDPEVTVVLLDVVIGYGAHPNPAGELAVAITKARQIASHDQRQLVFIASVTGTESDPQQLSRQVSILEQAGVTVCDSNASAARLAAMVVRN